jgi:hypothetical protein
MTRPIEPSEDDDDSSAELLDAELPRSPDDLPPIDFSTFIVSLRTSAMLHLGHASADDARVDLALARQEIDLLCILEDKTRGNLTGDEERLLSQILFDLRTRYVAACSRKS